MDPALSSAVADSHVLSEEQKKRLLSSSAKLTPEQVKKVLEALEKAEAKYQAAKQTHDENVRKINETYLHDLKQVLPNALKKIETKMGEEEKAHLKDMLSDLDNV